MTTDRVHVRAGQSVNFETLYQLNKGDQIVVVDRAFSWYKIKLPTTAKSYVSDKYVQLLSNTSARITADEVNIRGGAGITHTILGQAASGTQVRILEKLEGWYRIEPVEGTYGWVTDEYVGFAAQNIPPTPGLKLYASPPFSGGPEELPASPSLVIVQEPIKTGALTETTKSQEILPVRQKATDFSPWMNGKSLLAQDSAQRAEEDWVPRAKAKAHWAPQMPKRTSPLPEVVTMTGYLEQHHGLEFKDIQYRLENNSQPSYYIQGLKHALDKFLHHKVTVEGTVKTNVQSQDSYPVIIVSKIQLVL